MNYKNYLMYVICLFHTLSISGQEIEKWTLQKSLTML